MKRFFLLIAGVCCLGGVAKAEIFLSPKIVPSWMSQLSAKTRGSFPAILPARYTYLVTWKGEVNAGRVTVEYANPSQKKPGMFVVSAKGESTGIAASLYQYRGFFWSEIDEKSGHARLFTGDEDVEGKHVNHEISFDSSGVKTVQKTKEHSTGQVFDNLYQHSLYPVHDLFSSMLWVRGQALKDGDSVCLIVQPGDTPYLVKIDVLGREKFAQRNAIKMSISMQKIKGDTLELKHYKKLKSANLWISDDEERALLEIRAAVFIGDVRVTLEKKENL